MRRRAAALSCKEAKDDDNNTLGVYVRLAFIVVVVDRRRWRWRRRHRKRKMKSQLWNNDEFSSSVNETFTRSLHSSVYFNGRPETARLSSNCNSNQPIERPTDRPPQLCLQIALKWNRHRISWHRKAHCCCLNGWMDGWLQNMMETKWCW